MSCAECDRPAVAHGWCLLHYKRWRKHGDVTQGRLRNTPETIAQRFTVMPNGCHEYSGSRDARGRAKAELDGKTVNPVRVVWALHNGPIPAGMFVCHRCDNPPCIRPDHLFLGTPFDNQADMRSKGREYRRWTDDDCLRMTAFWALGFTQTEIARLFGTSQRYVSVLINR